MLCRQHRTLREKWLTYRVIASQSVQCSACEACALDALFSLILSVGERRTYRQNNIPDLGKSNNSDGIYVFTYKCLFIGGLTQWRFLIL